MTTMEMTNWRKMRRGARIPGRTVNGWLLLVRHGKVSQRCMSRSITRTSHTERHNTAVSRGQWSPLTHWVDLTCSCCPARCLHLLHSRRDNHKVHQRWQCQTQQKT